MILEKEYKNNKEKIIDFCIGFLGPIGIMSILSTILNIIYQYTKTPIILVVNMLVGFTVCLGLIVFFRKRRKYISVGILSLVILGMLIGLLFALGGM